MYGQVALFFPQRKEPEGSCGWGLVKLEESLAVTSKSRRLEERRRPQQVDEEKPVCSGQKRAVSCNVF